MKLTATFLLFALGLFAGIDVWAQKPDLIYKTDSSIVQGYNVRVKGKVASFQVKPTRGAATQSISTQQIIKIVWANGRREFFQLPFMQRRYTPLSVRLPNVQQRSLPPNLVQEKYVHDRYDRILTSDWKIIECVIQSVSDKGISYTLAAGEQEKKYTISRKSVREYEKNMSMEESQIPEKIPQPMEEGNQESPGGPFRYSSFTLGVEGSYILPNYSPFWTSEKEGKGLRYTLGGTIQFTKRLGKILALTSELGYAQWQSDFFYLEKVDTLYSSSTVINILPLKAGLQIFFGESLYIQPLAQLAFFQLSEKAHHVRYNGKYHFTQNSLLLGGTLTLGKTWRLSSSVIADMRVSYSILPKHLHTFSYNRIYAPAFNALTFGVGLGYRSTK